MKWTNKSVKKLINENTTQISADPAEIIREKARELVLQAFNMGWTGPPFSPVELARILKIEVGPLADITDARIVSIPGNKLKIEYNPYQKESRINFSIAHELGHTLFSDCHEKTRNREESKGVDNWELEFLCDIAASEILLPYAQFANEANSSALTLDSILKIANKYEASLESVFLRFCEVVDKPCAMLIASFNDENQTELTVEYFKASREMDIKMNSGYKVPSGSKAYECLNAGWTAYGMENWEVFGNSKYMMYSIGLMPLKKNKRKRVGIFVVPEFYDETAKTNIYTVFGDATKPRGAGNKIIAQLLNTTGGTGIGFGKSMAVNWPESKKVITKWKEDKKTFRLGGTQLSRLKDDTYLFQFIAQAGLFPKDGIIPLKYDILKNCLKELAFEATKLSASIHIPQIGAGQAKGDWNIILGIIHDELANKGIPVNIYILPGTKVSSKVNKNKLLLFDESAMYAK